MKKTYSAPKSVAIQVVAEGPLASLQVAVFLATAASTRAYVQAKIRLRASSVPINRAGTPTTGARKNKTP